MKQLILFRSILVLIMLVASGCVSNSARSTPTLPATPPAVEGTSSSTSNPSTESATPDARSAASPAATVMLFTQSDKDYHVNLTPADFVDVVDNPYFPLPPGAKWEFEIRQGNGSRQTDTLEVMKETRNVNGVKATVVRDTVSSGSQIVEDTYDWFVQDKYGNVWYVGESVDNYVGGVLASHAGSWEWGVDGAQAGIIMWADPSAHVDEKYRQEYYPGRAEDLGKVLGVGESLTVPYGSFEKIVKTLDTSALETNAREQKFYAPGLGLLRELDLNTNEEMVLIKFTQPAK